MILFFGTRPRSRLLGEGMFHCPFCYQQRPYSIGETRTWVHVFWIPLVPLGSPQQDVRCGVCGGRWAPHVLQTEPLG